MSVKERQDGGGRGAHCSPYLLEVERRKKASVLLHEQGQGAPCLKCGDNCVGGFSLHYWRKVCTNCRCSRDDHDIPEETDLGVAKIGKLFDDDQVDDVKAPWKKSAKGAFVWVPPGAPADLVDKYMGQMPKEHRPIAGSVGAENRKKELERQLPSHDFDANVCHGLSPEEVHKLDNYVKEVKKYVVGRATVDELRPVAIAERTCEECGSRLGLGEVAVRADKVGADKLWHPHCFRCAECRHLLVDLIYFAKGKKVYCGRHYAETTLPRCSACDELIFAKEYTQAEGQTWHFKHFACWNCDTPLANLKYVPDGSKKPHCLRCYDKLFGKVCLTCRRKIAAGVQRVSYGECHYHADDDCFRCGACKVPLLSKKFISKPPYIFCTVDCKRAHEATL